MQLSDARVRWAAIGAALAVTLGTGGLVSVGASGSSDATLVPVSPVRILDTRSGDRVGDLSDGAMIAMQVTGRIDTVGQGTKEVVPAGASAIVGNLTMVDTTANDYGGYATIYPCGTRPDASNLNFVSGQTVANSVAVPLSAEGAVCIFVYGMAHVLLDVSGYYSTDRLSRLASDPLAEVDCPETASLIREDDAWVCAPTPGVDLVEDANGRQFVARDGVVEIDGASYSFYPWAGFVSPVSGPDSYYLTEYFTTADCSGAGYMLTAEDISSVDPSTVFEGTTYLSGQWGTTPWGRIATDIGSTTLKYWRLEESSTITDAAVVAVRVGELCVPLNSPPDWNGAVAYKVVWLGESITEQFESPFRQVYGSTSSGNLCLAEAESDEPGDVSALVC